jgi:TonB family protein
VGTLSAGRWKKASPVSVSASENFKYLVSGGMKVFLSIIVLLIQIVASTFIQPAQQNDLPALVSPHLSSIVRILAYDEKGKFLREGGGLFVSDQGEIVTLFQVLEGAARAEVKTSSGQILPVSKLLSSDSDTYLLRLSVATTQIGIKPFQLSDVPSRKGEKLAIILDATTIQEGIASEIKNTSPYRQSIEFNSTVSLETIGAPVINMKGELIGVSGLKVEKKKNVPMAFLNKKLLANTLPASEIVVRIPELARIAIRREEPVFPQIARSAGVRESIIVEVIVDQQGNVIAARAEGGPPILQDSSIQAARKWKFPPSKVLGMPVKGIGKITFNFIS